MGEPTPTPTEPPASEKASSGTSLVRRRSSLFARGEPMVWLCGGALAICLLMAVGLIVLVGWQGGRAFWPKELTRVETSAGKALLGEPANEEWFTPDASLLTSMEEQSKDLAARARAEMAENDGQLHRMQLRIGNYELTGAHYAWVTGVDGATETAQQPEWAITVERLEWGRFYGTPKAFSEGRAAHGYQGHDETQLTFTRKHEGDPAAVWEAFEALHETIRDRWKEAREIEKDEIGSLNDELKRADLDRRRTERDHGVLSDRGRAALVTYLALRHRIEGEDVREGYQPMYERLAALDAILQGQAQRAASGELQETFDRFAGLRERALGIADAPEPDAKEAEAPIKRVRGSIDEVVDRVAALDFENAKSAIVFETASGQEKVIPLAEIVRAYPANQLGWLDKLGVYASRWWEFLTDDPREANAEGGVWPAIFGTVVMTLIMSLLVVPFGVLAALYLREYAKQGALVSAVRIAVNNLAGVPSIVFGVFGLGFFCYIVGGRIDEMFYSLELKELNNPTYGKGGLLWASLTLALLTLPVVVVATEEALSAVPNSMREGSFACGASKWQTIRRIILPRALPGIMTGMILSVARGAGEVAPLMLVGAVKLAPDLPIDGTAPFIHPERSFMHLGFHIYDLGLQSSNSEAARPMVYTSTMLLIGVVVVLNLAAIWIRARLRKSHG